MRAGRIARSQAPGRGFESLQLRDDPREARLAVQLGPGPHVLPAEQETKEVGRADRLDLAAQAVEHAPVDAGEQPPLAPLRRCRRRRRRRSARAAPRRPSRGARAPRSTSDGRDAEARRDRAPRSSVPAAAGARARSRPAPARRRSRRGPPRGRLDHVGDEPPVGPDGRRHASAARPRPSGAALARRRRAGRAAVGDQRLEQVAASPRARPSASGSAPRSSSRSCSSSASRGSGCGLGDDRLDRRRVEARRCARRPRPAARAGR